MGTTAHLISESGTDQAVSCDREARHVDPHPAQPAGYIATAPDLTKTRDGSPRFHARFGVEQFRKDPDGSFSKLDPIHGDLVAYDTAAKRAFEQLRVGDSFVAAGYVNESTTPARRSHVRSS